MVMCLVYDTSKASQGLDMYLWARKVKGKKASLVGCWVYHMGRRCAVGHSDFCQNFPGLFIVDGWPMSRDWMKTGTPLLQSAQLCKPFCDFQVIR